MPYRIRQRFLSRSLSGIQTLTLIASLAGHAYSQLLQKALILTNILCPGELNYATGALCKLSKFASDITDTEFIHLYITCMYVYIYNI